MECQRNDTPGIRCICGRIPAGMPETLFNPSRFNSQPLAAHSMADYSEIPRPLAPGSFTPTGLNSSNLASAYSLQGPKARPKPAWGKARKERRPRLSRQLRQALKEGVTKGCITLQSKRSNTRSRGEKATAVTASSSGKLCVPAPLRDTLFQKDLCSRRGAETQRKPLRTIGENRATSWQLSKTPSFRLLAIPPQPLTKTLVIPSERAKELVQARAFPKCPGACAGVVYCFRMSLSTAAERYMICFCLGIHQYVGSMRERRKMPSRVMILIVA